MVSPLRAQNSGHGAAAVVGRVAFDFDDAPAAKVAVDLNQGMLSAISGMGKAAIQGVVEGLAESEQGHGSRAIQESSQHLDAINEVVQLTSSVLCEVRVRVYEGFSDQPSDIRESMIEHYESKLDDGNWDNVVRVQEGDDNIVVRAIRRDSAIHGVFVIVCEHDELVMVNVVCELSPEKIQQLTSQATKIGMKFGLEEVISRAMEEIHRRRH